MGGRLTDDTERRGTKEVFLYIFILKKKALSDIDIDGVIIFGFFPVCDFSGEMSRVVSSEFGVLSSMLKILRLKG